MTSAFPLRILNQLVTTVPFQLYRRSLALNSPRYNLETLGYLDERLDGMLAGILELTADELAAQSQALNTKIIGGTGVLAYYAAQKQDATRINALAEESAAAGGDKRAEFLSAMQWLELEQVQPIAASLLHSSDPAVSEIGLATHLLHRIPKHEKLVAALKHAHKRLRVTAVQSIGELGLTHLSDSVAEHLPDEDETVRFASATTLARAQPSPEGIGVLHSFVEQGGVFAEEAAFLAGTAMPNTEWLTWMNKLADSASHTPFALRSAIGQGDIRMVGWFLHLMNKPEFSLQSGEALSALTGVDLATAHLNVPEPANKPSNLLDDLPEPDLVKLSQWWEENKSRYPVESRWFLGKPVGLEGAHHALLKGNQRQRVWAVKKLGRLRPDKQAFPVTAPAFRQKKLLGLH